MNQYSVFDQEIQSVANKFRVSDQEVQAKTNKNRVVTGQE